ncbi:hypothetical protein QJQ45_012450 [Haematococcus lacustris]|nr:hypothetical protein QJQ45_012450 [Haematococcus lacustris]
MRGKKRKGADEPKQPKPKVPEHKPKGKPSARDKCVKSYLKGFIRGRRKVNNKIVAHFKLIVNLTHKKRKLASLGVLLQLVKCLDVMRIVCLVELEEAADVSQQQWGTRRQLVVFFGNAAISTRGGWGAKAVLQAYRKVVESPQPCEEELDSSKPTRPEDWKPNPAQVQHSAMNSPSPVRRGSTAASPPGLKDGSPRQATPGDLGNWVDRDCNAALNLQRAGESKWRPLELCRWQHRARLPAQGKESPALGFKKLRDRAPKAQAQQPVAQ